MADIHNESLGGNQTSETIGQDQSDSNSAANVQNLVEDLEQLCASDSLSIKQLQGKTRHIPREAVGDSEFLHLACANPRVSKSIVKHLTHAFPRSASVRRESDGALPLHVACSNPHCPGPAIILLLSRHPEAASAKVEVEGEGSYMKSLGMPLHCYIGRKGFKHQCEVIECLVNSYPEALVMNVLCSGGVYTPLHLLCGKAVEVSLDLLRLLTDEKCECLTMGSYSPPLISLLRNRNISSFPLDSVKYFIEHLPKSSLTKREIFGRRNVLHAACSNEFISVEALQVILDIEGNMIRDNEGGSLPIHELCANTGPSHDSSLNMLKMLVDKYPESVRQWKDDDQLPIHLACKHQSLQFCKYLIDKYPEGALMHTKGRIGDERAQAPIHIACAFGSLEIVEYLFELNPRSIREQTSDDDCEYDYKGGYLDHLDFVEPLQKGNFALHLAIASMHADRKHIVRFILEKDDEAASRVGKWGRLPLHEACACDLDFKLVREIAEAYPQAFHTKDMFGRLPIHFAMGCDELRVNRDDERLEPIPSSKRQTSLVISYLIEQLPYSLKAKDQDGSVCAHYASSTRHALLKMKLIDKHCTDSFKIFSAEHGLPIHMACQEGAGIDTFEMLLAIMYRSSNYPFLHSLLLDDGIPEKFELIKEVLQFSRDEKKTVEFQSDVWRKDKNGRYPLHLIFSAFEAEWLGTEDGLENNLNDQYTNLAHYIIHLNPEVTRAQDNHGWLPLHHALKHHAPLRAIKMFLQLYPDGIHAVDKQGSTSFHLACQYQCSQDIIELLIEKGDLKWLTLRDKNGCTPVHVASRRCLPVRSICYLIELNNSVLTMPDKRGELPLHKACRDGHLMLIKELVKRCESTVTVRNIFNELPIFILFKKAGKDKEVLESATYVETIWQLLLAYPETVLV